MRWIVLIAASLSIYMITGSALAESPHAGAEPFGRQVVAPAARAGEIKEAVHENVPRGLDDVVQSNLADDEGNNIRGHGRVDAPGKN
jgi:hypothetical protein